MKGVIVIGCSAGSAGSYTAGSADSAADSADYSYSGYSYPYLLNDLRFNAQLVFPGI